MRLVWLLLLAFVLAEAGIFHELRTFVPEGPNQHRNCYFSPVQCILHTPDDYIRSMARVMPPSHNVNGKQMVAWLNTHESP